MQYFRAVRKTIITETVEVLAESREEAQDTIAQYADGMEWDELGNCTTYLVTEA